MLVVSNRGTCRKSVIGAFPYKNLNFFVDIGFSISNSIDFYQFESLNVRI